MRTKPTKPFNKPRYKCQEIRNLIEKTIRDKNLWGQRLAGDRDQAKQLGVSLWTVQAALAELEADRLIERRHGSGTYVVERPVGRGRTRPERVALIAARSDHETAGWHYAGEVIRGALAAAARMRAEAEVLSFDRPETAARLADRRDLRGFDAFVLIGLDPPRISHDLISQLLQIRGRPVILCDDTLRDLPVTSVVDGSFEGMRTLTRHILHLGHRRIAFLDCYDRRAVNPEKHAGYCAALREHGIDVDDRLVMVPASSFPADVAEGSELERHTDEAVRRLLALPDPATAIIGFNDSFAVAAMRALARRGLTPGQDFCLAGFGDGAIRRGVCDSLTSCRIYPRKIGEEAVRAALATESRTAPRTLIIPDRLIVRKSSCAVENCRGNKTEQTLAKDTRSPA